jgi:hypothetical protein
MRDSALFSEYLTDKIAAHLHEILNRYIENPDDIVFVIPDVIEAIQQEILWDRPA